MISLSLCFVFLVFCIPQRVILAVMCFLAIAIAYVMRVCLNVAITEMVYKSNGTANATDSKKDYSICQALPSDNITVKVNL